MEYGFIQCTTDRETVRLPLKSIPEDLAIYVSSISDINNIHYNFMEVPYTFVGEDSQVHITRCPGAFIWLAESGSGRAKEFNDLELKTDFNFYHLYDDTTGLIHYISNVKKSAEYWGYNKNFKNLKSNEYQNPLVYGVLGKSFIDIKEAFKEKWFYQGQSYHNLGVITSWKTNCGIYEYVRQLLDKANFNYTILTHLFVQPEDNVVPCFIYENITKLKKEIEARKIDNLWIHYSNSWFRDDIFSDLLLWLKRNKIKYTVFAHSEIRPIHEHLVGLYISGNVSNPRCIPIAPIDYENNNKIDYMAIGTFGFAHPHKRFEDVFDFLVENKKYKYYIYTSFGQGASEVGNKYIFQLVRLAQTKGIADRVIIQNEYLPEKVLLDKLGKCGVVTVCYKDIPNENQSAVVALLRATGRPIISSNSNKVRNFADCAHENITTALKAVFSNIKEYEKRAHFRKSVYTKDIELYKHMYHIQPYGDLKLSWRGDFHGVTSFKRVNSVYMDIFTKWGAIQNLTPDIINFNVEEQAEYISNAIRTNVTQDMIKTGLHFPPLLGTCHVPILAWEIDKVPPSWISSVGIDCRKMVAISNFTRDAFIRGGFNPDDIVVNPLGISNFDIDYCQKNIYEVSNMIDSDQERPFTFLDICWCEPRKGTDILLDAYTAEFSKKDNVVLVIKTNKKNLWVEDLLNYFKTKRPNSANILILEGKVDSLSDVYQSADIFVHPHRGEGFGLPILEAAGYGIPSIVTKWAGPLDFTDETNCWYIKNKLIKAEYHHFVEGARWAQPNTRHLRSIMRYVYNHPQAVKEKGMNAFLNSFKYTWEKSAFNLASVFYEVSV